jgi:hypothetical protein
VYFCHSKTIRPHTQLHLSEHTHTAICPKISIAALYYIEYAFDKFHQQLTINQLILAFSIVPVTCLRLMLAPPN